MSEPQGLLCTYLYLQIILRKFKSRDSVVSLYKTFYTQFYKSIKSSRSFKLCSCLPNVFLKKKSYAFVSLNKYRKNILMN